MAGNRLAYPRLDDNIRIDEQEVVSFTQLLYECRDLLQNVNGTNIDGTKEQLANNLIEANRRLTNWLTQYRGSFNSTMLALYVKTAQFAVQESALQSIRMISPAIQSLLQELQSFARNSSTLNARTQLKFNLLQSDQGSSVLGPYLLKPETTFNDIIGFEEEKERIRGLYPPLLTLIRKNRVNTLLLYGPPGTGKSYFIAAMADELKADFFALSAAQLLEPVLGASEKRLNDIFNALKNYPKKAVLFFDEFEQVFPSRSNSGALEVGKSLTVQLMELLSGPFGDIPGNIVIAAATNLLDSLDPALRSRMQPQIYIGLPSLENKKLFLERYLTPSQLEDVFNYAAPRSEPGFPRYSNRDMLTLGEGILSAQVRAVHQANVFEWTTVERRLLNGDTGPGYIPVSNTQQNAVAVTGVLEPGIPRIIVTEDVKINHINLFQRPDPLLFLPSIMKTINPISQQDLDAYSPYMQ